MYDLLPSRDLPALRPFEVALRSHVPGTAMADDWTYRWSGQATDEAHAYVLARRIATEDGWTPDGPISCRVVESVAFLPVASEWTAAS